MKYAFIRHSSRLQSSGKFQLRQAFHQKCLLYGLKQFTGTFVTCFSLLSSSCRRRWSVRENRLNYTNQI